MVVVFFFYNRKQIVVGKFISTIILIPLWIHFAYLLFINLLDHSHSKGHLFLFPSDDDLSLIHAWRGDINASTGFLHHLSHNLIVGTSDEGVVHLINVHPLHSTLVLKEHGEGNRQKVEYSIRRVSNIRHFKTNYLLSRNQQDLMLCLF